MTCHDLASSADLFLRCDHGIFHDFCLSNAMNSIGHNINALERVRPVSVRLDTTAAVTKPPPVISLQVGVCHSHVTESLPSVIFHIDQVRFSLTGAR